MVDASMHTMVEHLAIQKPILANQNAAFRFLVLRPQWFSRRLNLNPLSPVGPCFAWAFGCCRWLVYADSDILPAVPVNKRG